MRKLFTILMVLVLASSVIADPDTAQLITSSSIATQTNYTDTSEALSGYIVDLKIMCPASVTANVSLVVLTNANYDAEYTIYSNATLSGSVYLSPRAPVHGTDGVALGIATNGYEAIYLSHDKIELRALIDGVTNKIVRARTDLWK